MATVGNHTVDQKNKPRSHVKFEDQFENKTSALINKSLVKEKKERAKDNIVAQNPVGKKTAMNVLGSNKPPCMEFVKMYTKLENSKEPSKNVEQESSKARYFVKPGGPKPFTKSDYIKKFDSRKESFRVSTNDENVKPILKPIEIMHHVLALEENPVWLNYRVFGDPSF